MLFRLWCISGSTECAVVAMAACFSEPRLTLFLGVFAAWTFHSIIFAHISTILTTPRSSENKESDLEFKAACGDNMNMLGQQACDQTARLFHDSGVSVESDNCHKQQSENCPRRRYYVRSGLSSKQPADRRQS